MNGIIGMTGLLLDTQLTREQMHFANTVRTSAEALLSIINDILDFSKMEAGRLEFEYGPFEIRPLLEGVVDILAPRVKGRDVELTYVVPTAARGTYFGDAGRLRQVLLNLAGNAIKFTETGSVHIAVSVAPDHGDMVNLRIEVADTGIGIAESAKARLFTMFTQADSSTARKFGGTGLGLAISKRIVDLMQGRIGFDSTEGKGSVFWFEVSLRHDPAAVSDPQLDNPLAGVRLLVVDDNATNREVFEHQLHNWGARVDLADSAAAGLMAVRRALQDGDPYALALLDHHMPGMSGLDLAAVLRADPGSAALKLVMASSANPGELRGQFGGLRLDEVLSKPVRQSALLDCLMLQLGRGGLPRDGGGSQAAPALSELALRVLVVEDNPINQQVAVGLLSKLGHRADVADDGAEAVTLVERGDYDLILMDMQMPRMDGLTATGIIRALPEPKSRVTIVAMTANAMEGDRETCLAAGMDDYLAKPIDRHRLFAVLDRWTRHIIDNGGESRATCVAPTAEAAFSDIAETASEAPLMDDDIQADLTDALGADSFKALLASFRASVPARLGEIRAAIDGGDHHGTVAAAHSLKGAASNLGFPRLALAAGRLESAAKDGDSDLCGPEGGVVTAAKATLDHLTRPAGGG